MKLIKLVSSDRAFWVNPEFVAIVEPAHSLYQQDGVDRTGLTMAIPDDGGSLSLLCDGHSDDIAEMLMEESQQHV